MLLSYTKKNISRKINGLATMNQHTMKMDDKWSGNNFLLGSSSIDNHGG
jgi:hypothetical protein